MGSGSSNANTYCVDDKTSGHVEGFAKSIFIKYEFPTLKVFCNTYDIRQKHLVTVFKMYLTHEEVFLIEFRELADIFFPAIYTIPFKGLEDPTVNNEFTFPRFCILSYIFGMQCIPDLILQYFALLRRNLKLKISAFFFYFNIENMLKPLTEELKRSTGLKIAMRSLENEPQDREVALRDVVKLGLKYPILFYALIRFRRLFMRYVYGDKFWKGRKHLKLKMKLDDVLEHFSIDDVIARFENEQTAIRHTAIAIITDITAGLASDNPDYAINIAVVPYVTEIDETIALLVKDKLGYKDAKELIEESELPLTFKPLFMYNYEQLEASAAAEREESEREAAEYSQMLSHLSQSRKSEDDSDDEDSLEDDEEHDHEAEDHHDEEENDVAEGGDPPPLISSKSSRGMLSAVGGSFKFLTRGLSSKNIPTEAAIDEPEGGEEDNDDEEEHEEQDKVDKADAGDEQEENVDEEDAEGGKVRVAPAPAVSVKVPSSRSMLGAIGGSFKRFSLSRRNSSARELTSNKSAEEEESLDGAAIAAGGSSKSNRSKKASAEDEHNSEDNEGDVVLAGGEGSSAKDHSGSAKSAKLQKQKSLGYDFSAVMKNLDASDGDTTDDEESRKKKKNKHKGHHGRHGGDDDDEEEREIVIDKTPVHSGVQVIYDAQYQRHFKYNVVSGRSNWALDFRGSSGVIKQTWTEK